MPALHTSTGQATPRLWDFPGGLHLDEHKIDAPIRPAPIPRTLVFPLAQHIGAPAKPVVEVGDTVLRGQTIAAADGYVSTPIHASTSGQVVAIEDRPVAHPSGLSARCIVIASDGRDKAVATDPVDDWRGLDPIDLRKRVRDAGVVGLGGAAFPSFIKLNPGSARIDTLVLNGAECEPYISCDQAVMAEQPDDIVRGAQLIMHAVGARETIIGIEDNKPRGITALRRAIGEQNATGVRVVVVPSRYPQGGEKQLIQTLTGREIPSEGLPLDIGIVCHNVATAAAVWRAVTCGEALTERVVTVTGPGVATPSNLAVRFGTPVEDLLAAAGGTTEPGVRLIMGGPMMGFVLSSGRVPAVKATNCILALRRTDVRPDEPAMPCIRCGACADVCPAGLLPQQLYWHARAREFDKTQRYSLFDCIECGCCAQVCPSHIPLVQHYRFAKTEIWAEEREKRKADAARDRHEFRQERLERQEAEKKAAREAKKAALQAKKAGGDPVGDVIAKAKAAKQAAAAKAGEAVSHSTPAEVARAADKSADDPVAAAMAKAKARKAQQAAKAAEGGGVPSARAAEPAPQDDPVAAALAKAKAAKAKKREASPRPPNDDPVAAALAKAKAAKAAKAQAERKPSDKADDDPVAAALAKAKAAKAARRAAEDDSST